MSGTDQDYRAHHAKELLDDPMLKEAFEALFVGCVEQLQLTRPSDDARRFELVEQMKVIRAVRSLLEAELAKAKVEAKPRMRVA